MKKILFLQYQNNKLYIATKIICFCIIAMGLFFLSEKILVYKYYWPVDAGYITKSIEGMYQESENIDVLAVGTSHMMNTFIPLELYENYGIISYNVASYNQPIYMSYYLLKEAIKTNKIKVCVYDIGSLLSRQQQGCGVVMDSAHFSCDKVKMSLDIAEENEEISFWEIVSSMARQHGRWKELNRTDFKVFWQPSLYSKGYNLYTDVDWAKYSVEEMNNAVTFLQESEPIGYEFTDGEYSVVGGNSVEPISVSEENKKWLLKMRDLCEEEGVAFLCTKIPSVYQPELYNSAWTLEKSNLVKEICIRNGITFNDMLYDADLGINDSTDYIDGGIHLNHLGAQKVTDYLGTYLTEHYSLPARNNTEWDYDLQIYQEVRQLALLQLDFDFNSYISRLTNDFKDKIILIAVSDDMASGLSEEDIQLLQAMGLQTDFRDKICDSYVAWIDHGIVKYEKLSNRRIGYSGTCDNIPFYIESSGYYSGEKASIIINGIEYAVNGRGMNIVVYDDTKNLLYDSVRFDTSSEVHYVERSSRRTECVRNLETYLMERN